MKIDYKKQGKRNRVAGAKFEKRVREDLESKGWIVSKWQNNVNFTAKIIPIHPDPKIRDMDKRLKPLGKCVPSKPGRFKMMQTGFPDFIVYREGNNFSPYFEIQFVECKTNGYLSKEEKEKAKWYLKNNYCSKFLIAKKVKKGRKVVVEYKEFVY